MVFLVVGRGLVDRGLPDRGLPDRSEIATRARVDLNGENVVRRRVELSVVFQPNPGPRAVILGRAVHVETVVDIGRDAPVAMVKMANVDDEKVLSRLW